MTFILACLMMAALSANAQISKVILQHQGNVTMYEPDDIQTAINAAQDGDTILLNKGSYPGFKVEKKISVIGAGDSKTIIKSNIEIAIPYINNQAQELTANMLEGLDLSDNSIKVTKAVNGLKLKKCVFYTLTFSNAVKDVFIDRCKSNYSSNPSIDLTNVVSLKAKNSCISRLSGKPSSQKLDDVEFINCYFGYTSAYTSTGVLANFVNSWFLAKHTYASNCTYNYCLVRTEINDDNKDFYPGSYYTSTGYSYYNDNDRLTVASNNYLGNDGTVVGPDGGTTPYTLVTTAPKILDESSAVVSTDMKALNVNIKVTPN